MYSGRMSGVYFEVPLESGEQNIQEVLGLFYFVLILFAFVIVFAMVVGVLIAGHNSITKLAHLAP